MTGLVAKSVEPTCSLYELPLTQKSCRKRIVPPLQRSRARVLFSEKAGRLFEPAEGGEFLPAPKKAIARGKPKAKLPGALLLVLFLAPRKVHE